MNFGEICEKRYSARAFSDVPVDRQTVAGILSLIRLAPTALNHQPYRVIVAQGAAALRGLAEAKATLYGAKTVLVLCSERDRGWANRYSGEAGVLLDMGIVTATALYAAREYGVESCCVCNFDPAALSRNFALPANLTPDALILLGYPAPECRPSDRHTDRRAVADFTEWRGDGAGN